MKVQNCLHEINIFRVKLTETRGRMLAVRSSVERSEELSPGCEVLVWQAMNALEMGCRT